VTFRRAVLTAVILPLAFLVSAVALPRTVEAAGGRYLTPRFSVKAQMNRVYGQVARADGSVESLKLDLYVPRHDRARHRAVVIFIHGGNWTSDKSAPHNAAIPIEFAKRGFVGASLNYRQGVDGSTEQSQYDTRAAVRWFRANAAALRINPNRIVVMGSSYGAVNAMSAGFDPDSAGDNGSNPGYSSRVAAIIDVAGYVKNRQEIGPGDPPLAVFHAEDDNKVPYATGVEACELTKARNNVCEMYSYPSGGHPPGFLNNNIVQITEQASGFMCRWVIGPKGCH
jgi:acetyl esterase/lipase